MGCVLQGSERDATLPGFVRDELEAYPRCGRLELPTTWFEVTETDLENQLQQPLATLAELANPT